MEQVNSRLKRFFIVVLSGIRISPILFSLKFLSSLLAAVITLVNLLSTKVLLNALANQHFKTFLFAVLIVAGSNFLLSSINTLITPIMSKLNEVMNARIVDDFLRKSTRICLEEFEKKAFYDKYTLVFDKCCSVFQTSISTFFSGLSAIFNIIITITILSWMEPICLIILLILAILQTVIGNKIKKVNYQYQKNTVKNKKKLNYIYRLFYIPEFMRDIRVNDIWEFVFKKKTAECQQVIDETYRTQRDLRQKRMLQILISFVETLLITSYLGFRVISGTIWLDMFVVSQSSYAQLKNAILSLLSTFNSIYENDLYTSDYIEFMSANETESFGGIPLSPNSIEKIEFRDVSFSYPNSSSDSLKHVSFSIERGEKVFVTGPNGSGKTTLIKLLLRLYEPTQGEILINGCDIRQYEISSLRQSFAVMFQDYAVYAFSIYENLCLSQNIPKNKVEAILDVLGLSKTVSRLKEGANTPVSCQLEDDGVELSGGEKQRLAIGRTILKHASVVIFDEPTSNLDVSAAQRFIPLLITKNPCTLILISHQLSLAKHATRILCFNDGKLVEDGGHEQLLKLHNGIYAKMHSDC